MLPCAHSKWMPEGSVPSGNRTAFHIFWTYSSSILHWLFFFCTSFLVPSKSPARISDLDKIGFTWKVIATAWNKQFQKLEHWRDVHGHTCVPISDKDLGSWVSKQRQYYKRGKLSHQKFHSLTAIGFVWSTSDAEWNSKFQQLCEWKDIHGHTIVPFNEGGLGWWANTQRQAKRRDKISKTRESRLNSIGFLWNASFKKTRKTTGSSPMKLDILESEKDFKIIDNDGGLYMRNARVHPSIIFDADNDPLDPQGEIIRPGNCIGEIEESSTVSSWFSTELLADSFNKPESSEILHGSTFESPFSIQAPSNIDECMLLCDAQDSFMSRTVNNVYCGIL